MTGTLYIYDIIDKRVVTVTVFHQFQHGFI